MGEKDKVEYADKTRNANENRIKGGAHERLDAKAEQNSRKRKWEKTRDARVVGWRNFLHNVDNKEFKTETLGSVGAVGAGNMHYKREENTRKENKCEGGGRAKGLQ